MKEKHGKSKTRLYRIWTNMRRRCHYPKEDCYHRYGGRGIKVCDEWYNSFPAFYDWALLSGYGNDLTIDRINNDGDYEPSNCRWATTKEQANNTSLNIYIKYDGQTKTLTEWCEYLGLRRDRVYARYADGIKPPRLFDKERLRARTRKINQFDLDGNFVCTYSSAAQAAKHFSCCPTGIYMAINGQAKTCQGYVWKYAKDGSA